MLREDSEEFHRTPEPKQQEKRGLTADEASLREHWASVEEQDRRKLEEQKLGRRCPFGGQMYGLADDNFKRRNYNHQHEYKQNRHHNHKPE